MGATILFRSEHLTMSTSRLLHPLQTLQRLQRLQRLQEFSLPLACFFSSSRPFTRGTLAPDETKSKKKHPTKRLLGKFQTPPSCTILSAHSELFAKGASSQTKQNWENFIKGFPATLTGDVVYRAGLFKAADENSDGHVTREELRNFLEDMPNTRLTEEQLDKLIQAADINRDGKLQLDEFINLFKVGQEKGVKFTPSDD